jgi:hypothetical protein
VLAETALLAWLWLSGGHWPLGGSGTSAVTITSEPGGSEVLVDGRAHGATPVTLALAVGSHQVQVGTEGAAWTQMFDVKAGQASALHVVQTGAAVSRDTPERGTLEITTEPAGLAVTIDRRPAGVSPISVGDLQPGTHEVTITRGTTVLRRTVSVDAGVPTAVLIATATAAGATAGATATAGAGHESGWLTVAAPVPVRILESGTLLGTSETPRLLLTVGRHDLEFVNETFGYRVLRTVQIAAGRGAAAGLEPATGTLSVNAQPWAEVWVDGKRVGETPIGNLSLPIGNHDLMVRHPQLGERRRTVAVSANTPARIGIDLRQ